MATIKIKSLKCSELQSTGTVDDIEVRVGGKKVAGPIGVHKKVTVQLGGIPVNFTGSTTVQLLELDGDLNDPNYSKADDLGTRPVSDDPDTDNNLVFDDLKHATYTLNYSVTSS